MKPFSNSQNRLLLTFALFGLIVPNGIFLYYSLRAPATLYAALGNPVSLVFIGEAFFLMFLFAWVLRHWGIRAPGWFAFIAMSLIGSMIFSVPTFLYFASRNAARRSREDGEKLAKHPMG